MSQKPEIIVRFRCEEEKRLFCSLLENEKGEDWVDFSPWKLKKEATGRFKDDFEKEKDSEGREVWFVGDIEGGEV